MIDLPSIEKKLGFKLKENTLIELEKGVNKVYLVDSQQGKLVIHLPNQSENKIQLEKAKRIAVVLNLLKKYPQIPTTHFFTYGKDQEGNIFFVQQFIEGRELNSIGEKKVCINQLARILIELHKIKLKGYGYLTENIEGRYFSWFEFLKKETYKNFQGVKNFNLLSLDYQQIEEDLNRFFQKHEDKLQNNKNSLIHGDIRLDNIIMGKECIAALIDWEWSLVGDPAWEFTKWDIKKVLEIYFEELHYTQQQQQDFLFRIDLYWVIKLIFIAGTFKNNQKNLTWAIEQFKKKINKVI